MIPFAGETVTLIRRTEETVSGKKHAVYTKVYLTGCSWRRTDSARQDGNGVIGDDIITCRIPSDQTRPRPGDLLILGRYAGDVTSAGEFKGVIDALKPEGGAFEVASVADNTRGSSPLPHWRAR